MQLCFYGFQVVEGDISAIFYYMQGFKKLRYKKICKANNKYTHKDSCQK